MDLRECAMRLKYLGRYSWTCATYDSSPSVVETCTIFETFSTCYRTDLNLDPFARFTPESERHELEIRLLGSEYLAI